MGIQAMKVPTIFTAVDKFSGVVGTMTRNMSKFNGTAQASAMRTSTYLNRTGTQMLGAGIGMATGIGYAVNEAVKFEKAMATVNTTIDNTTPEMIKKMGDEVLQMSKKIPKPISELTDALYDVVSAGIDARYSMTVLNASGRLAVSGLGTTKESVDVLTSSINSFNLDANESESIANKVFKAVKYGKTTVSQLAESFGSSSALVKNSNVSLEEYLATTAVLTTTGMTASRAQTQVASAVTALIKPSKSMQAVLSSLGAKDIPKFIKQNGGLVKTLEMVSKRAEQMGILTSKAFGRKEGFSAMLSLLGPLRSKFNEVYADMNSKADSMAIAFEKQTQTVSAGVQIMKNKMTILGITIGNQLIPRVNGFLDTLSPVIEKVTKWMDKNEGLSNALLTATLVLLGLGVAAKVGAVLFFGLSKVIALTTTVTSAYAAVVAFTSLGLEGMAVKATFAIASLWATIAPILAVVAVLGTLAYMMYKSGQTTKKFAQDKSTHLRIVAGEYESMESRIARSNARIVENMKRFKLDLESVKNTGKTISELKAEQTSKLVRANERSFLESNLTKSSSALKTTPNKLIVPRIVSDSDQAFKDVTTATGVKNLAGSSNENIESIINSISKKGGVLKVEVSAEKGSVAKVDDSETKGIEIYNSSTKKSSKND